MQVDDLNAIAEWIEKIAPERRHRRYAVLFRELSPDLVDLFLVAHDEAEVPHPRRRGAGRFEHRQKLVLADLKKSVALAFVEFFQAEHVLVKRDRLFHVVDFDRNVVDTVDFYAHNKLQELRASQRVSLIGAA